MRRGRARAWAATALISAVAWLAPACGEAQDGLWAELGAGAGRFSGVTGVAGHLAAGWTNGRTVVSGRATAVADYDSCILCQTEGDRVDLALLFGRQWPGDSGLFSVGAGVGYVKGQHLPSSTIGLAFEARIMARLGGAVGLGLYGFGNVNSQDSFLGVTLAFRFGGL